MKLRALDRNCYESRLVRLTFRVARDPGFVNRRRPQWIYPPELIFVAVQLCFEPSRMGSVSTRVSDFTICCVRSLYFWKWEDSRCAW